MWLFFNLSDFYLTFIAFQLDHPLEELMHSTNSREAVFSSFHLQGLLQYYCNVGGVQPASWMRIRYISAQLFHRLLIYEC